MHTIDYLVSSCVIAYSHPVPTFASGDCVLGFRNPHKLVYEASVTVTVANIAGWQ